MVPSVHVITLAVADLERALAFYRDGPGFRSEGIIGTEWSERRTGANGAFHDPDGHLWEIIRSAARVPPAAV